MNSEIRPHVEKSGPGKLDEMMERIARVVLVSVSGCFVWAIHSGDMFLICLALIVGGWLGLFTSLVAGLSIPDITMTIGAATGVLEGAIRGFTAYGWIGAVFLAPLGLVVGIIASIPSMVVIILILCLATGRGPDK